MSIKTEELKKIEKEIEDRLDYYKLFLLDSNEKVHTDKKGVLMVESLIMNNFICDWFDDFKNEMVDLIKETQTIELCKKFEDAEKEKVKKLKSKRNNGDFVHIREINKIFGDEE